LQHFNKYSRLHFFEKLSAQVTKALGSHTAIVIAFSTLFIWFCWGVLINFSDDWNTFIYTISSTITFLMVFIIQKSHNKDFTAIQLKLNELISAHSPANNTLIDVENMTELELEIIQKYYSKLSAFKTVEEKQKFSKWTLSEDFLKEIKNQMDAELLQEANKNFKKV
jgi:low affinity Fe/Cu permease